MAVTNLRRVPRWQDTALIAAASRRQHDATTAMEMDDWVAHGTVNDVFERRRGDVHRSLRRDGLAGVRVVNGLRHLHRQTKIDNKWETTELTKSKTTEHIHLNVWLTRSRGDSGGNPDAPVETAVTSPAEGPDNRENDEGDLHDQYRLYWGNGK